MEDHKIVAVRVQVQEQKGGSHADSRLERVDAGTFHDFHAGWITHLKEVLNGGGLPPGFFALAEQVLGVLTSATLDPYVRKANRIAIRHRLGRVVAVIEIVSPGNKGSQQRSGRSWKKLTGCSARGSTSW